MATDDDLHRLVEQLPATEIEEAVGLELDLLRDKGHAEPDDESRAWLDADLAPPLPPFDWGHEVPPEGRPVGYMPGVGLVVQGGVSGGPFESPVEAGPR
jgi:hypothetical protein